MQHPLLPDPSLVWTSALDVLEAELGPAEVDGWLRGAELLSMDQGLAKISVPTALHFERIRDRHLPSLCQALGVQNCELEVIELDIEQTLPPEDLLPISSGPDSTSLTLNQTDNGAALEAEPEIEAEPLLLNQEYVFDTFVVGPCNRFAHAAAHGVADRPGDAFNPLFLHGSVGLGKTHLMQSIAHRMRQNNPRVRIAFLSCEEFINHFVGSLQQGSISHFRDRYRKVDVLIVDDIQMLSNKQRTQEEFFHTFNALRAAQKQIILSSDAPPGEIPNLQERLVSRLNGV